MPLTPIQLKHGPFAVDRPAHWPGGPRVLHINDAESRLVLVKKSCDADWLTAVIRDRDVQVTIRLAAERRLRWVNKAIKKLVAQARA